jgi:hypothetical protein
MVTQKMIEDDLSHVEESETKSTYKLDVDFEICEGKGEKSAPKFVPRSNHHKEEEAFCRGLIPRVTGYDPKFWI